MADKNTPIGAGRSIVKQSIFTSALKRLELDTPIDVSYLGTPIYDNITFGSLQDKTANNYLDITGKKQTFTPLRLNEVLIDASMTKNVSSSVVRGRNGTIKQYISRGDFSILISGKISGQYDEITGKWSSSRKLKGNYFPEKEMQILVEIGNAGYAIPISSSYLNNICGVDSIVITDYRLTQTEGGRYSQNFEINCLSDKDAILTFTEEEVNDSEKLNTILGL